MSFQESEPILSGALGCVKPIARLTESRSDARFRLQGIHLAAWLKLSWTWLLAFGVLAIGAPLFVALPLVCDASLYDVCANVLLNGGIFYRDIVEINFPGMVWVHLVLRCCFGWSSEVFRVVDLVVILLEAVLLSRFLAFAKVSSAWRGTAVLGIIVYYLGAIIVYHCQRDTWMFLPVLFAVWSYLRLLIIHQNEASRGAHWILLLAWSACGLAFWIKPFSVVPAGCSWLALTIIDIGQRRNLRVASTFVPQVARLAGVGYALGLLMGLLLFIMTCDLDGFMHVMFWSATHHQRSFLHKIDVFLVQITPFHWTSLVLIAGLYSVRAVISDTAKCWQGKLLQGSSMVHFVLAVLLLSWLSQAMFLQAGYNYHYVPTVFLAITLLVFVAGTEPMTRVRWAFLSYVALCSVLTYPFIRRSLITENWYSSLVAGSTPTVRQMLENERARVQGHGQASDSTFDWLSLATLREELRYRGATDHQVIMDSFHAISVNAELRILPPPKYPSLDYAKLVEKDTYPEYLQKLVEGDLMYCVTQEPTSDPQKKPWLELLGPIAKWRRIASAGNYVILQNPAIR